METCADLPRNDLTPVFHAPMRIGITGSGGFIGSYLLKYLHARYPGTISVFVRNPGSCGVEFSAQVRVVRGELLSTTDCEHFVEDLDTIFYLAHRNCPITSDVDLPGDCLANTVPFLTFVQAVRSRTTRPHVIYFSSGGAVYANQEMKIPFRETDPTCPLSSYGIQKLTAESYLRAAAQHGYLTGTVLRVGNAYGTLLPSERMQGLIGVAVGNALKGVPVRLLGNVSNVRDYIHHEDVCRLAEMAMQRRGAPFEVFNCATQLGHTVLQILQLIEDCLGHRVERHIDGQNASGLTDWCVLDVSKAREQLGWIPNIDLTSGIRRMIHAPASGASFPALRCDSPPFARLTSCRESAP